MCNTLLWQNDTKSCYRPYTSNSISVAYPEIFSGASTNSVEDREKGDLGAVAPLVRGSSQFANE
jgi:hypothetical protein